MGNLFDELRKKKIQKDIREGRLDLGVKKPLVERASQEPGPHGVQGPLPEGSGVNEDPRVSNEPLDANGIPLRHFQKPGPQHRWRAAKPGEGPLNFTVVDFGPQSADDALEPGRKASAMPQMTPWDPVMFPGIETWYGLPPHCTNPEAWEQTSLNRELFFAIYNKDFEAVIEAINKGADVNAAWDAPLVRARSPDDTRVFSRQSAIEFARNMGEERIEDLLRQRGAKE